MHKNFKCKTWKSLIIWKSWLFASQVKDIYLHPDPFSVQNGLLTPTLKSKRPQLKAYFKPQIEDLYQQLDWPDWAIVLSLICTSTERKRKTFDGRNGSKAPFLAAVLSPKSLLSSNICALILEILLLYYHFHGYIRDADEKKSTI